LREKEERGRRQQKLLNAAIASEQKVGQTTSRCALEVRLTKKQIEKGDLIFRGSARDAHAVLEFA